MIKKIINRLKNFCYYRVAHNKQLTQQLIQHNREYVIDELFKYPSFINSGHLHFEKLFQIAIHYKLTDLKATIVDVGGADGITSIMFNDGFKNAIINVFEPLKENIDVLSNNIKTYNRIILHQKALGSEKKDTVINITHRITSSSLLNINQKAFDDDYMSSQLKPENEQKVSVDTIDHLFKNDDKILVLKLDVQGYELEVLKGASASLKKTCLIMVEMQNHNLYSGAPMYYDIDSFLIENNFTLLQFIPSLVEKHKQLEWDAIYINNNLLK